MATKKSKKLTTVQLVARYNNAASSLGKKPVKKFADRKTAERRVEEIEAKLHQRPAPRDGTRRAHLLALLHKAGKRGVTFEKLHSACGYLNEKSTRDGIYLLGAKNGYRVEETGDKLRLR